MEDHDSANGELGGEAVQSSTSLVPPYWSHRRYESYCSIGNTKPPPIRLEDHTEEHSLVGNSTWARGVAIDDYVLVAGSVPNLGNFVVWNCTIDTLDVSEIFVLDKHGTVILKGLQPPLTPTSFSQGSSCSLDWHADVHQGGSIIIRRRSVIA